MTEHPIIFSGEMVQAILEGKKVQTRRVIKPQPTYDTACGGHWYWFTGTWKSICVGCSTVEKFTSRMLTPSVSLNHPRPRCPYGIPGDLLWVRETWATPGNYDSIKPSELSASHFTRDQIVYRATEQYGDVYYRWRPSIFMPRWASRITLEVVSVRVEQVQEIDQADAKAEGAPALFGPNNPPFGYREGFERLWDSINAKRTIIHEWEDDDGIIHRDKVPGGYSWQSNPWVWAVEFKVVEDTES